MTDPSERQFHYKVFTSLAQCERHAEKLSEYLFDVQWEVVKMLCISCGKFRVIFHYIV